MAKSIVGLENVQPYKFSECSRSDYIDALRIGHGICLLNKPNEVIVPLCLDFSVFMQSLHNIHEMNAYLGDPVCLHIHLSLHMFQLENFWMDFDEIVY
jgi:hypothetical protein